MTNTLILSGLSLLCVIAIKTWIKEQEKNKKKPNDYLYQKKTYILTRAEKNFYSVISNIFDNEKYKICPMVRIADVLYPSKKIEKKERRGARRRIDSRHFDFVICEKKEMKIICAIELNDKSHESKERRERDEFIKKACDSAKLPLIEVKARESYNVKELKEIIKLSIEEQSTKI